MNQPIFSGLGHAWQECEEPVFNEQSEPRRVAYRHAQTNKQGGHTNDNWHDNMLGYNRPRPTSEGGPRSIP